MTYLPFKSRNTESGECGNGGTLSLIGKKFVWYFITSRSIILKNLKEYLNNFTPYFMLSFFCPFLRNNLVGMTIY